MSKKQAEAILTGLVTRIAKHLKKGERIRIVGLGILQVRKRGARMDRNPATGEAIQIKASGQAGRECQIHSTDAGFSVTWLPPWPRAHP